MVGGIEIKYIIIIIYYYVGGKWQNCQNKIKGNGYKIKRNKYNMKKIKIEIK